MKVIAHTGCMNTKMNSMESVLAGIREKADYIEVDVRFLENRPVLTHDRPLEGEKYVPLEEAVLAVRDGGSCRLALDLKEWDRIGELAVLLKACGMEKRAVYLGNFMEDMEKMTALGGGVPCFPNVYPEQVHGLDEKGLEVLAEKIRVLGVRTVGMNFKAVTPEVVKAFHQQGISLSVWTVDEEEDIRRMADMGADFITSDRPDRVKACRET
ncbi:MAG TPA: glycerophosphodiester phosphodiesterase [Candidatus Lachnoclostridium stercorigallinarum]|uniref:Glycerophosphodiester phosphodiesterase n=1 Tax=Candidatus Lachnoclostridium stercorigallinarum TaxID=2838634 RepID=A0A9D2GFI6_9FIRM|nr:glycerophosphodiester phosphodiesterase [Candidatus Lachnoclostridium stercorigallinarum]